MGSFENNPLSIQGNAVVRIRECVKTVLVG